MATRDFMGIRKRIKFVSKNSIEPEHFTRLPNRHPEMEFILDPTTRTYDWFVVYDDLPRIRGERFSLGSESLACPPENTILLTYEPSSVKYYGDDYANQFAYVLTSHEPTMLSHAGRHEVPPVGKWYYGGVGDALALTSPPRKDRQICIFLSAKRMGHTLHRKRFVFQERLIRLLPELDIFDRGFRFVDKKADCLDYYRYTVAMENHVAPHHWTEKLSDSFLGYCLPFYFGCPNAATYFPEESFIPIDIDDPRSAADTIRAAMASGEYERRLPAIVEARRRVIEEYNLANVVGDMITRVAGSGPTKPAVGRTRTSVIYSRRRSIFRGPLPLLRYVFRKFRTKRRTRT